MENASGQESFLALLSSVESLNGWISSQAGFPVFLWKQVTSIYLQQMRSSNKVKKILMVTCMLNFSLARSAYQILKEDDNSSDDEAIWTEEVACGDGYYVDTLDSERSGKAKSSENTPMSSYSDYDSGAGSRYCYWKQRPEVFSMSVSEKGVLNPIEIAMRSFCSNRSAPMFKPELGISFSSAAEGYQFYNLYSWVLGFSIRNGDAYQKKDGERTMREFNCQRQIIYIYCICFIVF